MITDLETLRSMIWEMESLGIKPKAELRGALAKAKAPRLSIAFTGKFQTGKSHIINRLFFGDAPLLTEGRGLCMSAVPVRVSYGETPIISWTDRKTGGNFSAIRPDREKILSLTAAEGENARRELFETVGSVELNCPNPCLKNVTVLDTPGIDDPDERLLRETTYKVLPGADAIIMVAEPRALSEQELAFLLRKVFSAGQEHFMVIVSCKPQNLLNEAGLAKVVRNIGDQLTGIGRSNIPVLVYSDPETNGAPEESVDRLRDQILTFAKEYADENRRAKVVRLIREQLGEALCELKMQSSVFGQKQNRLNHMKIRATERLNDLRSMLSDFFEEFGARATVRRNDCRIGFDADLHRIKEDFLRTLKETDGLSDAQDAVSLAGKVLTPRIEDAAVLRIGQFQRDIEDIFSIMKRDLQNRWSKRDFCADLGEVDGGCVGNWDAFWITAGDYLFSALVLPGGLFFSLGLRFLLGRVPLVKDLMPGNLLKSHMTETAAGSLSRQLEPIAEDFGEMLASLQDEALTFLRDEGERKVAQQQRILELIENREQVSKAGEHIVDIQDRTRGISGILERLL